MELDDKIKEKEALLVRKENEFTHTVGDLRRLKL
jgi:hypothetical protein